MTVEAPPAREPQKQVLTLSGLTPRAVVLGVVLTAATCVAVSWTDSYLGSILIGFLQFTPAAGAVLLLLSLGNLAVRRVAPRQALRAPEIVLIYAMVLLASQVCSHGLLQKFIPSLVYSNYYATHANHFSDLFRNFPQWAVPYDVNGSPVQPVARGFFEGLGPGEPVPWDQWLTPLASWGAILLLFLGAMICLAAILRRQWVDNEKLPFPFAALPLEMAQTRPGQRPFFGHPVMWLGFAVPTALYVLTGLHANYPTVPGINLNLNFSPSIQAAGRPWSDFGWYNVVISLSAIGIFFLLPSEVLFSMWFFFLFMRMQNVLFSAFGVTPESMPFFPSSYLVGYQVVGAYLVVVGYMVKAAWPHLRRVWRAVTESRPEPETELVPLRLAAWGLVIATAGMSVGFVKLGMLPLVAVCQVVVYLFVMLPVLARADNEAGFLQTDVASFRPMDLVQTFTSLQSLGTRTISALSLTDAVFMRDQRCNLLGSMLNTLKLADTTHLRRRSLLAGLLIGIGVALLVGGYLSVALPYRYGAINMGNKYIYSQPNYAASYYAVALGAPPAWDLRRLLYISVGAGLALFTAVMHMQCSWWGLSPLGMALSATYAARVHSLSFFFVWLLKLALVRYGGMKTFQILRPFFLGLILGEFTQAILWAILAGVWRLQAPYIPF